MALKITHPVKPTEEDKIDDNDYMADHDVSGDLPFSQISEVPKFIDLSDFLGSKVKLPILVEEKFIDGSYYVINGTCRIETDSETGSPNAYFLESDDGSHGGVIRRRIFNDVGEWEIFINPLNAPNQNYITFQFLGSDTYVNTASYNQLATNGYAVYLNSVTGKAGLIKVGASGVVTVLLSTNYTAWTDNHTLKVTRDTAGNFEFWYNGVSVGTVQDTTYMSFTYEYIGIVSHEVFNANCYIDWVKKDTITIPYTQITSVTFSDLDGDNDEEYYIEGKLDLVPTTSDTTLSIQPNSDSGSNYTGVQNWTKRGSNPAYTNLSTMRVAQTLGVANTRNIIKAYLFPISGITRKLSCKTDGYTSSDVLIQLNTVYWTNTADNITSLKFIMSAGIFSGVLKLYKMVELEI